ncbi:unnamed protein product [Caenorhabditis angaria]|uniref:VWFA domain-containing protein n=1 Tax=Caenorhabditis angaria TaxID=860376 RepID=A0A9P1N1Z6_9PELO|nr:unnamed protein product [Caenorhabditis angaria]
MPCCIVFILDTSGSMSTRANTHFSFFDMAKNYIETFIKGRTKNDGRAAIGRDGDRYFLLTTSSKYPANVKVLGEKAPTPILEEMKKIPLPVGNHPVHPAILDAFRLMHVNRAMTGIDAYGCGRAPQNTEQVLIILLTDGSGVATIPNNFKLLFDPPSLGSEMTQEAYRWDQKLFSVVFRIPSTPYKPTNSQLLTIDIDLPNIEKLCAATGGRSFSILSTRQINNSVDQILNFVLAHRIGVRFDCLNTIAGKQTSDEVSKLRAKFKKISEKRPVTNLISRITPQGRPVTCHWQIPESFFPVKNMEALPPRTAHPIILIGTEAISLNFCYDIFVDRLELEPCGVTEIVMDLLKKRPEFAIPAYISNSSSQGGNNIPFGCLRLNPDCSGVYLMLMPFNYPIFSQLVDDLKIDPNIVMNNQWKMKLDSYIHNIPFYCLSTTRKVLEKFKVKCDVNSSMSNTYAISLLNNLNRLKNKGKEEYDAVALAAKLGESKGIRMWNSNIKIERITSRTGIFGLCEIENDEEEFEETEPPELKPQFSGDSYVQLYGPGVADPELDTIYRSPWSSGIDEMVAKLNKMQANVDLMFEPSKVTLLDMARVGIKPRFNNLEELHNLPLKTMGEYEPYQTARVKYYGQPMKKIEEEKERTHAFGNPYKLKSFGTGIDEIVDSAVTDNNSKREGKREREGGVRGGPPRKKRGPLGVDAFDNWRIRRSISSGSSVADSSILDDLLMDVATTSNGESSVVHTNGFTNSESESESASSNGQNGSVDELAEMLSVIVEPSAKKEVPQINGKMHKNGLSPPLATNNLKYIKLSPEDLKTRKLLIAQTVRKPANKRAFEEIVQQTLGLSRECAETLIRFAVRESKRFKQKQLTDQLEKQLG